jgi:putative peptidoglycan lipid II flippase
MWRVITRVRRRVADADSQHKRIAAGFMWVSLFVLAGKLAGAAKEIAIAWRYGVSASVDAYVFLYNVITWPVSVWFSVLTVVLVPLMVHTGKSEPALLRRFRAESLGLTLCAGAALALLVVAGIGPLLATDWAGLRGDALQQALVMAGPLALTIPLGLVAVLFSVWMMASGRYGNTLLEAMPALGLLAALLLPSGWIANPLVWGTVAGFALQVLGLALTLRRTGELEPPAFSMRSPVWRGFWGSMGVLATGQFLSSLTLIVDQFFAAGLGAGALATLGYANRILALIQGMGALAIARSTLPVFSEARSQQTLDARPVAMRWAQIMFVGGLCAAALCAAAAPQIVGVLFQRGAFTIENTQAVASLFAYSLVQIPFYFASVVFASALGSAGRYASIALAGLVNLVAKLLCAYFLVERYQLTGLVLSSAVMYACSCAVLYAAMSRGGRAGRNEA